MFRLMKRTCCPDNIHESRPFRYTYWSWLVSVNSYLYTVFKCSANIFTCKISLLCAGLCFIHCLLYYPSSIPCRLYDVEEVYINVLALLLYWKSLLVSFVLICLNILTHNLNYKYWIQQSNLFGWKLISCTTHLFLYR